ncbi:MAG: energy transducer TonB [Gammaproteobacteria bacterium]|nr:energy transducer TonB [Gammaproteobacteria bacterium]
MSITRLSYSAASAGFITLALLVLMALLITQQELDLDETSRKYTFDFWRIPQPLEQPQPKTPPVKPGPVETPPPPQPVVSGKIDIAGNIGGYFLPPRTIDIGDTNDQSTGPGLMPLVKISPEYPARAATAGIEGYVVVEYTVTRLGLVINPRVIESYPHGYFESSALRAIQRFRYNPQKVDGVAVDMQGVRQKFTFELESKQI